jgi:hypothetical protein
MSLALLKCDITGQNGVSPEVAGGVYGLYGYRGGEPGYELFDSGRHMKPDALFFYLKPFTMTKNHQRFMGSHDGLIVSTPAPPFLSLQLGCIVCCNKLSLRCLKMQDI